MLSLDDFKKTLLTDEESVFFQGGRMRYYIKGIGYVTKKYYKDYVLEHSHHSSKY